MVIRHAAAALGVAAIAINAAAWDPPPPPAADPHLMAPPSADMSSTGHACTVQTLVSGQECVLESGAAATAESSRWGAARLSEEVCSGAARRAVAPTDKAVLAMCRREIEAQIKACGVGDALVDDGGRFVPAARACYAALQAVLSRVRFMSAATADCCRCAVENDCARSSEACNRLAAQGLLDRPRCAERSCSVECEALLPAPEPVPAFPNAPPAEAPRPTPSPAVVPATPGTHTT